MIAGTAFAKVNLGLRVGPVREDGFHPIEGIFQSVDIVDRLTLEDADEDSIGAGAGRQVADGLDNLAFRAVAAVRTAARAAQPLAVTLEKTIPAAAGLGGGSADAAAGLALAGRRFGIGFGILNELAPDLGSDVPFCLAGGTARVAGRGEVVQPMEALAGFALAIVVPPVEISTPAAFRKWDELGGPAGLRMPSGALPPALRSEGDLCNDLYPAAAAIVPVLDDWRADLEVSWGRPVMLSGSGPSLFGFFVDADEAAGAVGAIPTGARFAEVCDLSLIGWRLTDNPGV
jgi:4-diphosphocytidyl-2C-methyl-D-erythritol kinase